MFPTQEMQTGPATKGQRKGGVGSTNAIPSHAVAVRFKDLVGLHIDSADAPRKRGAPMLYIPRRAMSDLPGPRPLPSSDLLVFEGPEGGVCLRIQVATLHHVAIVSVDPTLHPHANVFPESGRRQSILPRRRPSSGRRRPGPAGEIPSWPRVRGRCYHGDSCRRHGRHGRPGHHGHHGQMQTRMSGLRQEVPFL